ncbi:MAG: Sua5/YciO/YrdC/YwlC family protein, partial [Actinomycetota bacterium]|nr:Sua5/YciO/YrdC/YwlC family protein [Actinomycetota bacterium]
MTSVLTRFDLADDAERETGLSAATIALRRGDLVVFPTDTVYGLAADAFDDAAVRRLLEAKGRGREMPPPVLVSATTTLDALAVGVPG